MDGVSMDRMTRSDALLLAAGSLLFFAAFAADPQTLCVHETVHCQNIREMMLDGDWLLPHYGSRPWLERPPLPFWLTLPFVAILGPIDAAMLIPPILMGVATIMLVAWMTSLWFGRQIAIMTGVILATTQEFIRYSAGAECDIFLCFLVTLSLALFVKIEFDSPPDDDRRFWGGRSFFVLAFFVALGLTNLTKGLIFGTGVALAPIIAFLLIAKRSSITRYLWLWGWLAYLAVGFSWPIAVWMRTEGALEFWMADYVKRAFVMEYSPPWYYFVQLPAILMPWTLVSFVGIAITSPRRESSSVDHQTMSARWFVFCWAIAPLLALSLSRHRHHHYLLHSLAPWSIYAAFGLVAAWRSRSHLPGWLRHPLFGILSIGAPGAVALFLFRSRLPSPPETIGLLIAAWLLFVAVACVGCNLRRGAWAFGVIAAVLGGVQLAADYYETAYLDRYKHDFEFLHQVCEMVPEDKSLLISGRDGALVPSWWMHYSQGRMKLLHNATFLRDDRLSKDDVYIVGRQYIESDLPSYGQVDMVLQSKKSRGELGPDFRYTLFRVRLRPDLVRKSGDIPFTALQATLREPGPFLD